MTRKDYQTIARAIHGTAQNVRETEVKFLAPKELAEWAVGNITSRIADAMAMDNPSFDRKRFIAACEQGSK